MWRVFAVLFTACLLPIPSPASDFDWLVREFARESGAKQVHVPFFGLARFVVAVGHPAGTSDVRLALFERGQLESLRFSTLTDATVGSSWKSMVRVRSAKRESTNIYVRPDGKHLSLLVTTLDGNDATFLEVRIQPQSLIRFVDDHRGFHR
ncbi:MAG: hypothetical protein M3Y24_12555 [Acidobacteriota bacterium]|nr:hypothetical protein [Acidobacteriota bacterium]